MRNIFIAFFVIGICGIANSSPIPENSTPSTQTAPTSTEKVANEAHSTISEKKGEKEIAPTTPSTTTKLPEHPKPVTKEHSGNGLGATETKADKNEASTSKSKKEDQTATPSSDKAEIKEPTTPSPNLKQEGKETTTSSSGKMESNHPSVTGQKDSTTVKPSDENKEKRPNNNKKPKKTSTAYLDKGKVVIFDGICGPDGCQIEGDIYDELVPLPHFKKQG